MLQDVLSMYRGASQALADMEQLITKYESDEVVRHWLEQARFKVRKVARLNYYEIIGVGTVASELEIKSAYKLRALEWSAANCPPSSILHPPPARVY